MNINFEKGDNNMDKRRLDKNDLLNRFNTAELIKYLNDIIDAEIKKSSEMDTDMIDECVDWMLELKGVEIELSEEDIKKRVNFIVEKNYTPKKRRFLLLKIAAVFIIVGFFIQTTAVMAFHVNFFGSMINWTQSMYLEIVGTSIEKDNIKIEASGSRQYKSIGELEQAENIKVLKATYLPNYIKLDSVIYAYDFEKKQINIFYDDSLTSLIIMLNNKLEIDNTAENIYQCNGINFRVFIDKNTILWEYNDNSYHLTCGFDIVEEYENIIKNVK